MPHHITHPTLQVRLHDDGFGLEPLQPGAIMAERYIRMRTMVSLCTMAPGAAIPDLISVLARWGRLGRCLGGMGSWVKVLLKGTVPALKAAALR